MLSDYTYVQYNNNKSTLWNQIFIRKLVESMQRLLVIIRDGELFE